MKDLWVTKLNNHQVNQHIQNVEKFLASNEIKRLTVDGNVILKTVAGVSKINNINFDELLNNVSTVTYLQTIRNDLFKKF